MGRRDQPDIHLPSLVATDPPDAAALEGPEQLGLQLERQGGDLIEKQGAAVSRLEQAWLGGHGAGEGPLLVPEELALQQVGWDRGAVHLDERLRRPGLA